MMIKNACKVASREARFLGCSIGLTISGCWLTKGCCSAARVSLSPSQVVETAEDALDFAVG